MCPVAATSEAIASATLRCLRRFVPAAVPGIAFLSGGQDPFEATAHLSAINQQPGPKPWKLDLLVWPRAPGRGAQRLGRLAGERGCRSARVQASRAVRQLRRGGPVCSRHGGTAGGGVIRGDAETVQPYRDGIHSRSSPWTWTIDPAPGTAERIPRMRRLLVEYHGDRAPDRRLCRPGDESCAECRRAR